VNLLSSRPDVSRLERRHSLTIRIMQKKTTAIIDLLPRGDVKHYQNVLKCFDYCNQNNFTVGKDAVFTALPTTLDWHEANKDEKDNIIRLTSDEFSDIVIYSVADLNLPVKGFHELIYTLQVGGIELHSVRGGGNTASSLGRLALNMSAIFAEHDCNLKNYD